MTPLVAIVVAASGFVAVERVPLALVVEGGFGISLALAVAVPIPAVEPLGALGVARLVARLPLAQNHPHPQSKNLIRPLGDSLGLRLAAG